MKNQPFAILLFLLALSSASAFLLSGKADAPAESAAVIPTKSAAEGKAASQIADDVLNSYAALSFDEVFVMPAGPKGLEFTKKCQNLKGGKVRMDGYMVRHYNDNPAIFLFAGVPAIHNQAEYILADSLPTSLVHVVMDVRPGDAPVWKPQRITVMGRLELGPRQEIDGRVSHIRLFCDQVADSKTMALLKLPKPLALQRDRMVTAGPPTNFRSSGTR